MKYTVEGNGSFLIRNM